MELEHIELEIIETKFGQVARYYCKYCKFEYTRGHKSDDEVTSQGPLFKMHRFCKARVYDISSNSFLGILGE
jgi:hypothetical protein